MDTTIYRYSGKQESVSKVYMQEMLHDIISDTTNEWDVKYDTDRQLYFILIDNNRFLIVDADVPINKTIIDKYGVKESPETSVDPFGLTFTLKSNTTTKRNLSEILYAEAYDRGSISSLSQRFMFKTDINAEAVFTTPLFLAAQPHIFVRYGPYKATPTATTLTVPADRTLVHGFANKELVPWTEMLSKRGQIEAYITDPVPSADALKAGTITVKTPGVYLINGFVMLEGVTSLIRDGSQNQQAKPSTTSCQSWSYSRGVRCVFCVHCFHK